MLSSCIASTIAARQRQGLLNAECDKDGNGVIYGDDEEACANGEEQTPGECEEESGRFSGLSDEQCGKVREAINHLLSHSNQNCHILGAHADHRFDNGKFRTGDRMETQDSYSDAYVRYPSPEMTIYPDTFENFAATAASITGDQPTFATLAGIIAHEEVHLMGYKHTDENPGTKRWTGYPLYGNAIGPNTNTDGVMGRCK